MVRIVERSKVDPGLDRSIRRWASAAISPLVKSDLPTDRKIVLTLAREFRMPWRLRWRVGSSGMFIQRLFTDDDSQEPETVRSPVFGLGLLKVLQSDTPLIENIE